MTGNYQIGKCQKLSVFRHFSDLRILKGQIRINFQTRGRIMELIDLADHYWNVANLNGVGLQGLLELIVIAGIMIFKSDITNWKP